MSHKLLSNKSLLVLIKCLNATHKQMHGFLPVVLNVNNIWGENKILYYIDNNLLNHHEKI